MGSEGRWRIWSWQWRDSRSGFHKLLPERVLRQWAVSNPEGRIRYFSTFLGAKLFVVVGIALRKERAKWQEQNAAREAR